MIRCRIPEIRKFMNALFREETFDPFFLNSAEIRMYTTTTIDGHVNEAFYKGDDTHVPAEGEYILWKELRGFCMELIKGRRTPLGIRLLFSRDPASVSFQSDVSAISALHLLVLYENNECTLTTGINYSRFSTDKGAEAEWDAFVQRFLTENGLQLDSL